jgi:hypothetical protein
MINKEDKIKFFVNEINDIKDLSLKEFAKELISNADDYFFTVPASSSGKYHPQFDLGEGGLVRHTRFVAFLAKCLAESRIFSDIDTDLLIIAALAHDITKQGDGNGKHTVWEHPELAKNYVMEIYKNNTKFSNIPEELINKICKAIHSHMGKWGNHAEFLRGNSPLPLPETEFEKVLQEADYVSSRREITGFDFRPTETVDIINEETIPQKPISELSLTELENYKLDFGKNTGKTLKEIRFSGYLEWMINQVEFKNKEAQDMARAYLNMLK